MGKQVLHPQKRTSITTKQTVWKGVRAWSRRTLEYASDTVMDIPLDDDEEELVDPVTSTTTSTTARRITNAS